MLHRLDAGGDLAPEHGLVHVLQLTGMITFEVAFLSFDYRQVSPRAIAVHQPREACEQAGFSPRF